MKTERVFALSLQLRKVLYPDKQKNLMQTSKTLLKKNNTQDKQMCEAW